MGDKTATAAPAGKAPEPASRQLAQKAPNPLLGLQQSLGNQAMLRLLESGVVQAKLRVSQAADPDEVEADRVAEKVVSAQTSPVIQRKCGCSGGAVCSKCAEDEDVIHRSVAGTIHRKSQPSIQRLAVDQTLGQEIHSQDSSAPRSPARGNSSPSLIVEDEAGPVAPGQMKKSQFMQQLRVSVCATADAALAAVGRNSKSCPYIEQWLSFYSTQGADRIERALHKYAPEAAGAKRAQDYIAAVSGRVRQAVTVWARTGRVTGVPAGAPFLPGSRESDGEAPPGAGSAGAGGGPSAASASAPAQSVHAKSRDSGVAASTADPQAVRERLGSGQPLDTSVRSRMEPAFGQDFSRVRLHTDSTAAQLSTDLNARAFTVGESIAFAPGEYKPGTLVGDALMAHELAHVVQQGGAKTAAPRLKGEGNYDSLEEEADVAAVGAVTSRWAGAKGKLKDIARNAAPRLRSGLQLQACRRTVKECPPGLRWAVVGEPAATGPVCVCAWRCLPEGVGYTTNIGTGGNQGPSVSCAVRDQFGRCPDDPNYERVDEDYEKREQGTKIGVGAHMSPLGEQAACGCLPLDIEGDTTGEKEVHAPLLPPGVDITDVLAPAVDVAAAAKSKSRAQTDPRTGTRLPDQQSQSPTQSAKPTVVQEGEGNVAKGVPPVQTPKTEHESTDPNVAPASTPVPDPATHVPPASQGKSDPQGTPGPGGQNDHETAKTSDIRKDNQDENATDKGGATKPHDEPASVAPGSPAPIGEAQIDHVQHLENETARLSNEANAADPQVKQAKSRMDQAAKTVSDLAGEVAGYRALTDDAAARNPALKDQVARANRQRDKLAKAQKELAKAKSDYNKINSEQTARYDKIRSNKSEIEKIARPELALKPTLRGVANELRVLREEGLLGIKKSFTLPDPKTGEVATTIPDGMRSSGATVDIKDVIELSETQQLRLQREISRRAGQKAEIITGTKTKVPAEMEQNYNIRRRPDLGPR